MKKKNLPFLGFCPIGKFLFSHEDALRFKKLLEERLKKWEIPYAGIDDVVTDGLVRSIDDVPAVVSYLKKRNVDAVFMPHCNFGTEHAVGLIGRNLGVPTLVWAPRDEAPLANGTRLRDSLCGLFASTGVLHKLSVPFTYIENCGIDDPPLKQGIERFLRAVSVADALRNGLRIGHIGQRIDFFWSTIINESELLERFKIEVLPIDMVEFIRDAKNLARIKKSTYKKEVKELQNKFEIKGFDNDAPLINVLAVRDQMLLLGEQHNLDGFAFQSFMSIINEMGAYCSLAGSMVGERYTIGAESDIHGVISNILLQRAAFNSDPAYLVDLTIRHPDNDNAVLLWHGSAPLSMCHPDEKPVIGPHWILPSSLSGMTHFRLKNGPITVARFDGNHGNYQLAIGEGKSVDGPKTLNNYVWMEVDNWPYWERVLMEGPFIHHIGMTYGNYADALVEACKYIPALTPVRLNG